MTRNAKIAFGVAIALAVLLAGLYLNERSTVRRVENALTSIRTEHEDVIARTPEVEDLQAKLVQAEQDIKRLESDLNRATNLVDVLEDSVDQAIAARAEASPVRETEGRSEPKPKRRNPMRDMLDSMGPEAMARLQTGNVVQMGYGRLLREWGLPAELTERVQAIIAEETEAQFVTMFAAMKEGNDLTGEQQRELREQTRLRIRERLEPIVTEQQLVEYDAHDVDLEMTSGAIEQQLNQFAPGLTEENHAVVREVLLDELYSSRDEAPTMDIDAADAELALQEEAYRNAEARLAELLTEEQLRQFALYAEQQMQMIEMMRQMMTAEEGVAAQP